MDSVLLLGETFAVEAGPFSLPLAHLLFQSDQAALGSIFPVSTEDARSSDRSFLFYITQHYVAFP